MNSKQVLSGGQVRRARRTGKFSMLNRNEQFALIRGFKTIAECRDVATDGGLGRRVRRQALRQAIHLGLLGEYAAPAKATEIYAGVLLDVSPGIEAMNAAVDDFDALVERFTAEGKPNPVRSAHASIAARKQAEQRKAAKQATA